MKRQQIWDLCGDKQGPVECLGLTFENDEARRAYFLERLREKLQDPEFRKTPGFPKASDEVILQMSDPPYYTACPNPFLEDFVRKAGREYDPNDTYHREPLAVDVSVGKTDQLYTAHSYITKVPHLAIIPAILHYTDPGDVVLDGFAGSGMTGVAAHWCNNPDKVFRTSIEEMFRQNGLPAPKWGPRTVILNDLSPYATYIAAGYNLPCDPYALQIEMERLMAKVWDEIGWMYRTPHVDGSWGTINYVVWSQVFACPSCSSEINFFEESLDETTKRVKKELVCPVCGKILTKDDLTPVYVFEWDMATNSIRQRIKLVPSLVNYSANGRTYERTPIDYDLEILDRIASLPLPASLPTAPFPIENMYHGSRLAPKGVTHVHHLFFPRAAHALASLWRHALEIRNHRTRHMVLWVIEQSIPGLSLLNRYQPIQHGRVGGSQVNRQMDGVYYIPSQISECSPIYNLRNKVKRVVKALSKHHVEQGRTIITTGTCSTLSIPDSTIDYIFTDPPFGANKYYADLNYLIEAWHDAFTATDEEAIIDEKKGKDINRYGELMLAAFKEYYRVLKPGRWMTVVFSNSSNAVWRAIQEALGRAGFVIADVRTLDKKQGSYRQVTSSAVKQDLVISAYKPKVSTLLRVSSSVGTANTVWSFVDQHLANVPVFIGRGNESEIIAERTPQMLLDRMIAFHVRHGLNVPIDTSDFLRGLDQRYAKRDGMYFLHDQVAEYDKKRAKVQSIKQLSFDITDEASAILWLRLELERKPQTFQELQPTFMRESQAWAGHEKTIELKQILEENFLLYDGNGPVPPQIHSYLSTNFKDMRGLDKDDPVLKAKAANRWYVPDPSKQSDLEQLRTKRLLKEFQEYKESKQRQIKLFRTEAVRAGFKAAYDSRDYRTIVEVARKLPEQVIQEDEKLLMYYHVALMRLGED